jgi:hypothetical protein
MSFFKIDSELKSKLRLIKDRISPVPSLPILPKKKKRLKITLKKKQQKPPPAPNIPHQRLIL